MLATPPFTYELPRSNHGYVDRVPTNDPKLSQWPGNGYCGVDAFGDPTRRVTASGEGLRAVALRQADGSWRLLTGAGKLFGRAVPGPRGVWRLLDAKGMTVLRASGPDGEVIGLVALRPGWGETCLSGEMP